jgi:protein CpxP
MKKTLLILLMAVTFASSAQQHYRNMDMRADFSPEQQAILKTKQMVLHLDLTEAQQKQMLDLNKKWAIEKSKQRESFQKLNKDELSSTVRFNHMNDMLNRKIAHQNEIKKILNQDQYDTWKKMNRGMDYRTKRKMAYHGRNPKGQGK